MKSAATYVLVLVIAASVVAPSLGAFVGLRHKTRQQPAAPDPAWAPAPAAATVAPTLPPLPIVNHVKEAGNGYLPGSPLFAEQAKQQVAKKRAHTEASASNSTDVAIMDSVEAYPNIYAWSRDHPWKLLGVFLLELAIVCLFGFLYCRFARTSQDGTRMKALEKMDEKDFHYGLFEVKFCCKDLVCFTAWCCPVLRISDTVSTAGVNITSFWTALIVLTVLSFWNPWTGGLFGLVMFVFFLYCRQQLRAKYGLQKGGSTWGIDCLMWCCCSPCAIAQEARQVEDFTPPRRP